MIKDVDPYDEAGTRERVPIPVRIPYTYELAELIISKIFDGMTLTQMSGKNGIPDKGTIFGWLHRYPDFRSAYDVARESLALIASEEIQVMSEDAKYLSKDDVPASKHRFDILKFIAERNDRTRYAQTLPKDDNNSGVTIVIDTGVKSDPTDSRTVSDLVREMREDEYSEGYVSVNTSAERLSPPTSVNEDVDVSFDTGDSVE